MIPQRQQPAYDPMAQMMQILQFALGQNQQVAQQANQDRNYALDERQVNMRGKQFDTEHTQRLAAQQADQEYRRQQAANTERGFALDEKKLSFGEQDMKQRALMQQQELKQQEQQAIMAALSRAMPQDANGFDDPSALYQYLQQMGVQVPTAQAQPGVDSQAEAEKARARAILSQLLQQQQQ